MPGKPFILLSALGLAALSGAAEAEGLDGGVEASVTQDGFQPRDSQTGGGSYGDRNRGGQSGFYAYPRHRQVDKGRLADRGDSSPRHSGNVGTSPYCDNCHGSAYYGRNYGAPYFGGGYYDQGVYYRQRRGR